MKQETYLKLKSQKRKARFLAILTALSLFGCTLKDMDDVKITKASDEYDGPLFKDGYHIEIVDRNGSIYPVKRNGFNEAIYTGFSNIYIPLYDSHKEDKNVINYISEYQTFNITHSNDLYSYITTEEGFTGYVDNSFITILPDNYIEVDLSMQKVKVVENNEIILCADVVTGKPGTETDIGYTEVLSKTYNRPLIGPGYRLDVKYFIHFNNSEEGFHDNHNRYAFGKDIYLTNGSHGCVNMALEDVKIMDEHTKVGTKVLVHK